jgi:hypothetical protein
MFSKREEAMAWAKRGYSVLRLKAGSKEPIGRGIREATNNLDIVYSRWTSLDGSPKNWNVGLRCKGMQAFRITPDDPLNLGVLALRFMNEFYGEFDADVLLAKNGIYIMCEYVPVGVETVFFDNLGRVDWVARTQRFHSCPPLTHQPAGESHGIKKKAA